MVDDNMTSSPHFAGFPVHRLFTNVYYNRYVAGLGRHGFFVTARPYKTSVLFAYSAAS